MPCSSPGGALSAARETADFKKILVQRQGISRVRDCHRPSAQLDLRLKEAR